MLCSCIMFISCFIEPKKSDNINSDTDLLVEETLPSDDHSTTNQEPIIAKKFVYIKIKAQIPVLRGHKSEFYGDESYCYVELENEVFYTDIIEIESYNEDSKYKLIDNAENEISERYKFINNSLYSAAVVDYGYAAAKVLKENTYKIKIIDKELFPFESYSEASINKQTKTVK